MNLLRAAATVSGLTLLSRVTGLVREVLTASIFGASAMTDAFFVAFRISVMGGEQAASVLATVKRDGLESKGEIWSAEDEAAFKDPIREQYERQGHPFYASSRLWDDGVIDPADTRRVLALALSAALNAPIERGPPAVYRM